MELLFLLRVGKKIYFRTKVFHLVNFFDLHTFTDRQVVAPLCFATPDVAVDFVAADQLVPLSAPEGQHTANGYACATLHVEGTPARWQDRDTGQT